MAYVKRHSTNNLKASIDYITNQNKTDELLIYKHRLPNSSNDDIVEIMNLTKANYNKKNRIQGHHFIQSFSKEDDIVLELAHQVGMEWANKFINHYEYVLSTHKDKDHIHNHIIINSVSYKDGKKYLSDVKEREYIRELSDEVCKKYNLSIIKRNERDRNSESKSYGEWKYNNQDISWKDKIRLDINDAIKNTNNYKEFIKSMKEKGYELRYGEKYKYNSFEHKDIGRRIRGKTLGERYTEKNIIERIKNREYAIEQDLNFDEKLYFLKGISNKELAKTDIDLSILQSKKYSEFIKSMENKNYILRYGEKYKHNSFRHRDMGRAIRGKAIGENYTENGLKRQIKDNAYLLSHSKTYEEVKLKKQILYSKRHINNKFKYLKSSSINKISSSERVEELKKQDEIEKINVSIELLKENKINTILEYMKFKETIQKDLSSSTSKFNELIEKHNMKLKEYNNNKSKYLRNKLLESKKKIENLNSSIENKKEIKEQFKTIDKVILRNHREKERSVKRNDNFVR